MCSHGDWNTINSITVFGMIFHNGKQHLAKFLTKSKGNLTMTYTAVSHPLKTFRVH